MNKLIVAAAGSGKTTYLVNEALQISNGNVLISTFTDANEQEIRKRFYEINGSIPSNITIMPWFSFLLRHGVKPYQSYITNRNIKGIHMVNGQMPEVRYLKDTDENSYITKEGRVYSDKISKLVYKIDSLSNGCVFDRICKIFSRVLIDEVQDFSGYDLEIFKELCHINKNMLLVGDIRQATYSTHFEQKNKKYASGGIVDYAKTCIKNIIIDETSLNITHRNNKWICDFANSIYPEMNPCDTDMNITTGHDGIFWVKDTDTGMYLKKYHPVQLRNNVRIKVNEDYQLLSYGTSKGLSFDRVLIYPTKPIYDWITGKSRELKDESRSKFYVAVTRARYSVAFVYTTTKAPDTVIGECWKTE